MPDLHTDINIHETINSGQIFLWENYRDVWFVIDGHDIIMAKQIPKPFYMCQAFLYEIFHQYTFLI